MLEINIFLVFSNHFDVLILKIIFKKIKKFILIYFLVKNILKTNQNLKTGTIKIEPDSLNLDRCPEGKSMAPFLYFFSYQFECMWAPMWVLGTK